MNVQKCFRDAKRCGTLVVMAGKPSVNLALAHFGRQLHKERTARGWSLPELAERTGINAGHLSRIERGIRPPTEHVAVLCDQVFPERRGWFTEYYEESKSWTPPGLRSWAEYEDRAEHLSVWSPGIVHGLFQTEAYARALLEVHPGATGDMIAMRLQGRLTRQHRAVLRDDAPAVVSIIDHAALYRLVGSPEVMAGQCRQLLTIAALPHVTMQVLPAVAHPATASEMIIADGRAVYAEHVAAGGVYTETATVTRLERLFTVLRAECYRASESQAIIRKAEETWTGERQATVVRPVAVSRRPRVTA